MTQSQWNWERLFKEALVGSTCCSCERVHVSEDSVGEFSISELKERANVLYKQKRLVEAEQVYLLAIRQLENSKEVSATSLQNVNSDILQVLYSNLSQTRLLLKKFPEAERDASKAIDLYKKGTCSTRILVKSLLRRSSAFVGLCQFETALETLATVQRLEPDSVESAKIYSQVQKALESKQQASVNQSSQRGHILDSPESLLSALMIDKQKPEKYFSSQFNNRSTKSSSGLIKELSSEEDN